jgi:hypothetical protein
LSPEEAGQLELGPDDKPITERARPFTGAPGAYKGSEIIQNSKNGICHSCSKPFKTGEDVSVDHFVRVRALPSLSLDSRNMRVSHPGCNSRMADYMPTVEDAQLAGMSHLAPLIKTLNPRNVRYRVSATPVSLSAAGAKQVHFSLPNFDQHTDREFLPDGSRHPEVTSHLDAVEKVHGRIPGFDRGKDSLFHPSTKELHPAVKNHLLSSLPDDFKPHVSLLKGWRVWLKRGSGTCHSRNALPSLEVGYHQHDHSRIACADRAKA